ncbi:uncharacterized protein si:ch211-63p21.1 [Trichomycterus rosablanca]|uniref:uncharacterized protein si:ch211-63p21.1 n=1 Tax=Trichomycterus rosablanca TaxID=2290929 RepID=UPI002F35E32D
MEVTRRRDSSGQFSDNSDHDCEESGPKCNECGKNRALMARYSEGYGTEEECVQSDPQRESDADADIEDADSRLQVVGSLQRVSSRKRRRQKIARQDTTESEDDGGQSHRSHRWSLRLSPHRTPDKPILEESVSQVRPLVICHCNTADTPAAPDNQSQIVKRSPSLWPFSLSLPLFFLLIILPISLSVLIVFFSFLFPLIYT